jgi:hypothetical protein
MRFSIEHVARVCHEANREFSLQLGQIALPWGQASASQRAHCIAGVRFRLQHLMEPIPRQHAEWKKLLEAEGWHYGPTRDEQEKHHPNLVEFGNLPLEEQAKNALFVNIVRAFAPLLSINGDPDADKAFGGFRRDLA